MTVHPEHFDDARLPVMGPQAEVHTLTEELRVHRVELEMQNAALREAQVELETSRDRYAALFDLSPMGYLVLDSNARVREANLTSAGMFGMDRVRLVGQPLTRFVEPVNPNLFRAQLDALQGNDSGVYSSDVRLTQGQGAGRYVRMESRVLGGDDGAPRCLVALTDITDRKLVEEELARANAFSQAVMQSLGQGLFVVDHEGRLHFLNPEAERLFGYRLDQLRGRFVHPLVCPDHGEASSCAVGGCPLERALERGMPQRSDEARFARADGTRFPVSYVVTPIEQGGTLVGAVGAFQDITQRRRLEQEMRLAYRALESTSEGVMLVDRSGRIQYVNDAFCTVTGYTRREVLGQTPSLLKSGRHDGPFYQDMWERLETTGRWKGEIWNRRKNGEIFPEWLNITAVRDAVGEVAHFAAVFSDVSTQDDVQRRLHHLAYYDELTGLPNRYLLRDRLSRAILHAKRSRRRAAFLFLDLDRFKLINDTLGHDVGDALLRTVAARLKTCARATDTIARHGGDEFVVLLEGIERTADVSLIARKILKTVGEPLVLDGNEVVITASIGISLFPLDGQDLETLVKNADTAMYQAKEHGRDNYQYFAGGAQTASRERLSLETDLRRALDQDRLLLHYQPQWDVDGGTIVGVEALVRWHHPKLGFISPSRFIPLAEDAGLIASIGDWVLGTACAQAAAWQQAGLPPVRMAVNVSPLQFKRGELARFVARHLEASGLDPCWLELELTERIFVHDVAAAERCLRSVRAMGVRASIDDFGTGFSSLSYLKRLPIDTLKIDKGFVDDAPNDPDDAAIVSAITAMAHRLRMTVIAEGVETQEQVSFLRSQGCDWIQGNLYGKAMPAEEMGRLLDAACAVG